MKLTLRAAFDVAAGIQRLPKLPIKASYRLSRIADYLKPEFREFEKQRTEIYKELGTLTEDGKKYVVAADKQEEVAKRLNELLDVEVTVTSEPVSLADMGDVQIEPEIMGMVGPVITE